MFTDTITNYKLKPFAHSNRDTSMYLKSKKTIIKKLVIKITPPGGFGITGFFQQRDLAAWQGQILSQLGDAARADCSDVCLRPSVRAVRRQGRHDDRRSWYNAFISVKFFWVKRHPYMQNNLEPVRLILDVDYSGNLSVSYFDGLKWHVGVSLAKFGLRSSVNATKLANSVWHVTDLE